MIANCKQAVKIAVGCWGGLGFSLNNLKFSEVLHNVLECSVVILGLYKVFAAGKSSTECIRVSESA